MPVVVIQATDSRTSINFKKAKSQVHKKFLLLGELNEVNCYLLDGLDISLGLPLLSPAHFKQLAMRDFCGTILTMVYQSP